MKFNITEQQYSGRELQLTEPHFDEEATLLSARRVVPLGDVRVEPPSGKRLAFALALVFAVIAGSLGGALIYKQRGQKQTMAIVDTSAPLQEPAVPDVQPLSGADAQTSLVPENVDVISPPAERNSGVAMEIKRSPPPLSTKSGGANEPRQGVAGNYPDERELRRAERMEARRLRREAKREARWQRTQSADDLLRIREIFEGSPRP